MSGVYEVGCEGCGQRHVTSAEQARKQRVVRCACGQFVRLDRALVELRSEPAPAPPVEEVRELADEGEEEEATHMLSSLAAVAALGGGARGSHGRASLASIHEDERGSRPVPRGTLRSLAPSPAKYPSTPPATDKPLWYVDLGGSETVQMTIEQLIIARRSGKLGEGALVWREGMPRWRPVGTLIPATSIAAGRPTPVPPAPSRPPLPAPAPLPSRPAPPRTPPPAPRRSPAPSPPEDAAPHSLASYERPLATLEFALEKSDETPLAPAAYSPLPSAPRSPSRPPPRGLTPMPRPATWLAAAASAPHAAPASRPSIPPPPPPPPPVLAAVPAPSPLPPRSPLPAPRATPIPTPLPSFTSDRPVEMPLRNAAWDWLGDRPRWVSACIALVVCVAASGSGAFLVRSLKMHRQPLTLTSTTVGGANQALPGSTTPNHVAPLAPAAAASAPLVVDLQSLQLEHNAPRRTVVVRPVAAPVIKPADTTEASEPSVENTDPIDDEAKPASQNKAKNADLPSAAHANPYTTGSDDSSAAK